MNLPIRIASAVVLCVGVAAAGTALATTDSATRLATKAPRALDRYKAATITTLRGDRVFLDQDRVGRTLTITTPSAVTTIKGNVVRDQLGSGETVTVRYPHGTGQFWTGERVALGISRSQVMHALRAARAVSKARHVRPLTTTADDTGDYSSSTVDYGLDLAGLIASAHGQVGYLDAPETLGYKLTDAQQFDLSDPEEETGKVSQTSYDSVVPSADSDGQGLIVTAVPLGSAEGRTEPGLIDNSLPAQTIGGLTAHQTGDGQWILTDDDSVVSLTSGRTLDEGTWTNIINSIQVR